MELISHQRTQSTLTPSLWKSIEEKTEATFDVVNTVANGRKFAIRHQNVQLVIVNLTKLIPIIATQYGARNDLGGKSSITKESVRLIMNHFSELAVFEIKEAYELWAAGIIEVPGGEMYGGVFSVKQLGKVLSAYKDYRRQISALIINAEHHEKERIALEKKKKRRKKEFEENFPLLLKKAKIKYRTWRDVPVWYYQVAMKRKMIQFTEGEADQILEEAKEAVRVEITSEQEKTMKSFKELAILRQLIDNQEERAKTYARQLTVWKKLLS